MKERREYIKIAEGKENGYKWPPNEENKKMVYLIEEALKEAVLLVEVTPEEVKELLLDREGNLYLPSSLRKIMGV